MAKTKAVNIIDVLRQIEEMVVNGTWKTSLILFLGLVFQACEWVIEQIKDLTTGGDHIWMGSSSSKQAEAVDKFCKFAGIPGAPMAAGNETNAVRGERMANLLKFLLQLASNPEILALILSLLKTS